MRSMVEGDARWWDLRRECFEQQRIPLHHPSGGPPLPIGRGYLRPHPGAGATGSRLCGINVRMRFVKLLSATSFTLSGPGL